MGTAAHGTVQRVRVASRAQCSGGISRKVTGYRFDSIPTLELHLTAFLKRTRPLSAGARLRPVQVPEGDEEIDEETMEELQAIIEADYEVRAPYDVRQGAVPHRTRTRCSGSSIRPLSMCGNHMSQSNTAERAGHMEAGGVVAARQSWVEGAGAWVGSGWALTRRS